MHRTLQQFAGRVPVPGSALADVDSKPNRASLERVVRAVVASTSGEYCQGQNLLAAATLVASNMDEAASFAVTHWLLVATGLHSLYTANAPTLDMFVECFRVYLQRFAPAVESSLNAKMAVSGFPKWMVIEWVTAMFSTVMPLPQVMCIIDLLAASRTSYPAFTSPDMAKGSPDSAVGSAAPAARTPVLSAGSAAGAAPPSTPASRLPSARPARRGTVSNTFKLRGQTLKGMVSPRISSPAQNSSAHASPVRAARGRHGAHDWEGAPREDTAADAGVFTPGPRRSAHLPLSASSAASAASRSTFYISTPPPTVGSALRATTNSASGTNDPQTPTRSSGQALQVSIPQSGAQGTPGAGKWWVQGKAAASKALALPGRIVSTFTTPQRGGGDGHARRTPSHASSAPALHAMDNILYRVCAGILLELAANHGLLEWDEDDFMMNLKPSIAAANFNAILARAAQLPPCEVEVLDTLITGSFAALPFDFHIGVEVVNFKTNPAEARSRVAGLLRSPKPVYRGHSRDGRRLKRGGVDGPQGLLHTPGGGVSRVSNTPLGQLDSRRPVDDSILSSRSVRRARQARHPGGGEGAPHNDTPPSPTNSLRSCASADESSSTHRASKKATMGKRSASPPPVPPPGAQRGPSRAAAHLRFSSVLSASSDGGVASAQLSSSVPDTVSPLRAGMMHVTEEGGVSARTTPLARGTPSRGSRLHDEELAMHLSLGDMHAAPRGSMHRGYASSTDSEDAMAFEDWYALGSSVTDWKPLTLSGSSSISAPQAAAANSAASGEQQAAAVARVQEDVPAGMFSWHVSSGAALRLEWMDVRRDGSRIKALRLPGGVLAVPTRPLRPHHLSLRASIPEAQVMDGVGMYFVCVQVLVAASCLRVVGASGALPPADASSGAADPLLPPGDKRLMRGHSASSMKAAVPATPHPAPVQEANVADEKPVSDSAASTAVAPVPDDRGAAAALQPVPLRKESVLAALPADDDGMVVVTQKTILHRYSGFVDLLQALREGATNKAGGSTLALEGASADAAPGAAADVLSKAHWLWFAAQPLAVSGSPLSPQRSRVPASLTAELRGASMWRPPALPEQLVKAFPPKRWFFNTDDAVLQERRQGLEAWLQGVAGATAPAEPALVKGFAVARSETSGARSGASSPRNAAMSTPPPTHASRVGKGVSPGAPPPMCRFSLHPALVDFLRVEADLLTLLKS